MRVLLCFILMCLLIGSCAGAVSLSPTDGLVEAPPAIHEKICANIKVEPFENDFALDMGISSLAISDDGEVAIVGKSSKADCDFILCVYASDGVFQYGFKVNYGVLRGNTQLFYSEDGRLSHQCCYPDKLDGRVNYPKAVVAFGPAGIDGCYILENRDAFVVENLEVVGTINVYVSPRSEYGLSGIDDAYVSIVDLQTGEIQVIYDKTAEHEEFSKAMSKYRVALLLFGAGIFVTLLLFTRNRNRMEQESKSN